MSFLDYFWKKPQPEAMNNSQYFLKVEFLTKEEKIAKSVALEKLSKMKLKLEEGEVAMYNYDNQYKVSYRETFAFPNTEKLQVSRLLELLQSNQNEQWNAVYEFYNDNVETVQLVLYGGHSVKHTDTIALMDLEDKLGNDSTKTVELIYDRKGFMSRLKNRAKKVVISLPGLLLKFIKRVVSVLVSWMGLNSVTSLSMTLFKSFVGTKQIMHYLLSIVAIFFPMLAPLLGVAKLIG